MLNIENMFKNKTKRGNSNEKKNHTHKQICISNRQKFSPHPARIQNFFDRGGPTFTSLFLVCNFSGWAQTPWAPTSGSAHAHA